MFNQFIDAFLTLAFLAGGIYFVYTFFACGRWEKLKPNELLYPSGCAPEQCRDPEGFLGYIRPRMLIFGLLCIATAVLVILTLLALPWPYYMRSVGFLLGAAICCVYLYCLNRAKKKFW